MQWWTRCCGLATSFTLPSERSSQQAGRWLYCHGLACFSDLPHTRTSHVIRNNVTKHQQSYHMLLRHCITQQASLCAYKLPFLHHFIKYPSSHWKFSSQQYSSKRISRWLALHKHQQRAIKLDYFVCNSFSKAMLMFFRKAIVKPLFIKQRRFLDLGTPQCSSHYFTN